MVRGSYLPMRYHQEFNHTRGTAGVMRVLPKGMQTIPSVAPFSEPSGHRLKPYVRYMRPGVGRVHK